MAVVEGDGSNPGIVQQPTGIPPRHDVSLERDECVRNDYSHAEGTVYTMNTRFYKELKLSFLFTFHKM